MPRQVPNLDLPLGRAARNQALTVRTELDTLNHTAVAAEGDNPQAGFHVPQAYGLVRATVGEVTAIGAEGETEDRPSTSRQGLLGLGAPLPSFPGPQTGLHVPDFQGTVAGGR